MKKLTAFELALLAAPILAAQKEGLPGYQFTSRDIKYALTVALDLWWAAQRFCDGRSTSQTPGDPPPAKSP